MATNPGEFACIGRYPGILGGEPVIAGTRLPVRAVVLMHRLYEDVAGVQRALPHLSRADIEGARDYYKSYRVEIDGHIAQNDVDGELLFREDGSPW